MTWTYDGDPSANDRDWIRFRVGDTDTSDQQLSDEEIASLLADEGTPRAAAVAACIAIAARYARLVARSSGDQSEQYQMRQQHYEALAKKLERGGSGSGSSTNATGGPGWTGRSDVLPTFRRGQFDFPGTGDEQELDEG